VKVRRTRIVRLPMDHLVRASHGSYLGVHFSGELQIAQRNRMFTLRCTARLRKRLGMTEETTSTPPSTKLGDWYAHLVFTRPL